MVSPLAKNLILQIRYALQKLKDEGKTTMFYISKMELEPADKELLDKIFAKGGIFVRDDEGLQRSEWSDTLINGVWRGIMYDIHGNPVLEIIEVAPFPSLVASPVEEIRIDELDAFLV